MIRPMVGCPCATLRLCNYESIKTINAGTKAIDYSLGSDRYYGYGVGGIVVLGISLAQISNAKDL